MKHKSLKNYTSTVSASKSISHIEETLAWHKAKSIVKTYDENGLPEGIAFYLEFEGKLLPFKLPAHIHAVEKILSSGKPYTNENKIKEQAQRTAWKIISDWIDSQLAMVEIDQAQMMEMFFQYIWDEKKNKSLFQLAQEKGVHNLLMLAR